MDTVYVVRHEDAEGITWIGGVFTSKEAAIKHTGIPRDEWYEPEADARHGSATNDEGFWLVTGHKIREE